MKDKAIIYNRVSTTEQQPLLQMRECEEYCKARDWDIIDRLQEQTSAFKDESKRDKFQEMIKRAEKGEFKHICVWNMDRFSRQPEEEVLRLVKKLNLIYGVDVNAVNGDLWSELVQSISKIKEQGFIGEAISEFLEKIIRGLEFQRAYRESKTKSERVKLAVIKKEGEKTKSYKGKLWGYHSLGQEVDNQIIDKHKLNYPLRKICREVFYWDKSRNKKFVSLGYVHKIIKKAKQEKSSFIGLS